MLHNIETVLIPFFRKDASLTTLLQRENFYTGIIERGIRERRKGKKEKKNSSEEEKEGKEIKKKIECHF